MATSKLLKPTNVTISIPEFTDQPDQRVNSNCIDKEADAINALSEQIAKQPITVTAPTGMTVSNNHSYKQGNVVCLNFQVSGTISSGTYIATIPQDIAIENYVFAVDYNNDKFVPIFMYGTGNLKAFGSASSIKINATYIV